MKSGSKAGVRPLPVTDIPAFEDPVEREARWATIHVLTAFTVGAVLTRAAYEMKLRRPPLAGAGGRHCHWSRWVDGWHRDRQGRRRSLAHLHGGPSPCPARFWIRYGPSFIADVYPSRPRFAPPSMRFAPSGRRTASALAPHLVRGQSLRPTASPPWRSAGSRMGRCAWRRVRETVGSLMNPGPVNGGQKSRSCPGGG